MSELATQEAHGLLQRWPPCTYQRIFRFDPKSKRLAVETSLPHAQRTVEEAQRFTSTDHARDVMVALAHQAWGIPDTTYTVDEDGTYRVVLPIRTPPSAQAPDLINHPPHYNAHPSGVECITIVEHFNFNIGNAIKYLWRAGEKGAEIEDLKKAAWYVTREIERLEKP